MTTEKVYLHSKGQYQISSPVSVEHSLPSDKYNLTQDSWGKYYLEKVSTQVEAQIPLPGSAMATIIEKINNFLTPEVEEKFKLYEMLYKRGILLYGPPGTGKTSVVNQVIELACTQHNMITLLNPSPIVLLGGVKELRLAEGRSRPVLVIWEELDAYFDNGEETDILNLLDGIYQLNNIIYLATTNHIEDLPPRVKNRPSRFADVIEIGLPNIETRRAFLSGKAAKMGVEINVKSWVGETEGMSIDHLKDLLISVFILGTDFDDAIRRFRAMGLDEDSNEA